MATTLHYFIAANAGLSAETLQTGLATLRRQFDLKIQEAVFEGVQGFTLSITVPESLIGNTIQHGQNVTTQIRNTLEIANQPRPVFPGRYAALRGPQLARGDMLLNFTAPKAANSR